MIEQRYYFYRPAFDRHLIDNAISAIEMLRTYPGLLWRRDPLAKKLWRLRTSHAEFADHTNGMMITSTMRRDPANPQSDGLVMRPSATVLTHPERWYYYPVPVCDESHEAAMGVLLPLVENNQGYDRLYIAKFITGPLGRKVVEWVAGRPLDHPAKFICSGITTLAAFTTIGEEWGRGRYWRLYFQLEKLLKQFNNEEPDPLSLSLAFYKSGLIPYSQVDDKPLIRQKGQS